jgi:UDP-N-acetylglucosamine 2-epimerase (non-hydrolysing)
MLKVLVVLGTRPEAIKLAPVIRMLRKHTDAITTAVCVTAQHRQMLDQALALFDIHPDFDLNVMQTDQTLAQLTSNVLTALDPVLVQARPEWVLVQGDTTTVMAAALGAFYRQVKVGHVEAGLRTWNKQHPFPEEVNRRIASCLCDLHFAPTAWAGENLIREGVPADQVVVTGNPVIDALHMALEMPYDEHNGILQLAPKDKRIILVTAHRRENFGRPFEQIFLALRDLAECYAADTHIVYPVHLNPNVQTPARRILGDVPNVTLTDPLDYLPLVHLMKRATIVLTDSGGIQEEAPGLGKPVLVLRETTERPEAVDVGAVKLVGADRLKIVAAARQLLDDPSAYASMACAVNPYGDGRASERIVKALLSRA